MIALVAGFFLALMPSLASGATRNFAVPSGNWNQSANWYPSGVPTALDEAWIERGRAALAPVGVSGSARSITLGLTGSGELNVFGGRISGSSCVLGGKLGGHGQLNVSSGTFLPRELRIGSLGTGALNLSGGLVDGENAVIGGGLNTSGTVFMTGGRWQVGSDLSINGSLRLVTGTLQVGSTSWIGGSASSSGTALVQGGRWTTDQLIVGGTGGSGAGQLDFRGGVISGRETLIGGISGSVVVAGGTLSTSLRMGTQGPASLELTGGRIAGDYGIIGSSGTGQTTATISNGHWSVESLVVGAQGNGILNLSHQGVVLIGSGTGRLLLGSEAGGTLNLVGIGGELQAAEVTGSSGEGRVQFNTSGLYTFSPRITGRISVKKSGTGQVSLEAANTYTGSTTVEGGMLSLEVNGSIGQSPDLIISPGAIFNASAVAGGRFTLDASRKLTIGLNKTGAAGRLEAPALDISNGRLEFAFPEQPNEPVYVIATYTSLIGTRFASVTNLPPRYVLDYSYNNGTAIAAISQNRAPVANSDSAEAHGPVTIPVVGNDSDPDGDGLFVVSVTQGGHGRVTISGSQSVTYSPGASFADSGGDSFTYQVGDGFGGFTSGTVSITKTNHPPVAKNDTVISSGSPVRIAVLANDIDPDGDALRVTGATAGAGGSVSFNADSVTYTPGHLLRDQFSYTIADGFGGTASATIFVNAGVPVITDWVNASLRGGGSPVSGEPEGTTLARLGVPAISDGGEMAYWALLRTGSGFFKALITGSAGSGGNGGNGGNGGIAGQVLVRQNQAAPDAFGNPRSGVLFATFADPVISPEGKIAFLATLYGKEVAPNSRIGLYTNAFGSLAEVARTGSAAPGIEGARLRAIDSVLLSQRAPAGEGEGGGPTLFFTGRLVLGGSATALNDSVLCCVTGSGSTLLLREGNSLSINGQPLQVRRFVTLAVVRGSPGQGRWAYLDSVVVQVYFSNSSEAILRLAPNQMPEIVAVKGDVLAAAPSGSVVASFGAPTLTGAGDGGNAGDVGDVGGRVRFFKDSRLLVSTRFDAILLGGSAGDYSQLLAQQYGSAPGVSTQRSPAAVFRTLNDPVINAQGYAAFTGVIGGYGINSKNNTGLWWGKPGNLQLVARKGGAAPGTKWKFTGFSSIALPDDGSEEGRIGPLLVATMNVGSNGLWAVDSSGILQLVVRKGSSKEVNGVAKTISNITVLSAVAGSPGQARSYNRNREVVYRLTFRDGSQEIVKTILP